MRKHKKGIENNPNVVFRLLKYSYTNREINFSHLSKLM